MNTANMVIRYLDELGPARRAGLFRCSGLLAPDRTLDSGFLRNDG